MEGGWTQVSAADSAVLSPGLEAFGWGGSPGPQSLPCPFPSVPSGGLKCPVCSFVYGTKWEFNRHLKNKHGLKLVENEGDPKWEVSF